MTDNLLDALAKPPPPPSELDELMMRDPLELSAQDIDKIIAMQRQYRARKEAAPTKRGSGIDLVALVKGTTAPKPALVVKPASGGGLRRL